MEEQREGDHRSKAFPIRLNYRSGRPSLPELLVDDSKDPVQLVSVFSYGNDRNIAGKSSKIFDKELRALPTRAEGELVNLDENPKRKTAKSVCTHSQRGRNSMVPPTRTENTRNKNQDLSDWLLLGKSMQDPAFVSDGTPRRNFSDEVHFRSRKTEGNYQYPLGTGLHTYPSSVGFEKCSYPDFITDTQKINCESLHSRENCPVRRSFSSHPLGESWSSYSERQKLRHKKGCERKVDELIATGRRCEFSQRSKPGPSGHKPPAELKRTSSSNSFKYHKNIPRSRSASFPQNKLDCHVILDWREKRHDGVTYVTPFLQSCNFEKPVVSSDVGCRETTSTQDTLSTDTVVYSEGFG